MLIHIDPMTSWNLMVDGLQKELRFGPMLFYKRVVGDVR